jgi:cytosine/adenosine deaminase-related metal-dependent hydrolase
MWPVSRLERIGGLGSNLVIAHAVALKDEEIGMLASHGVKVAFCPGTSMKIAKGATRIGRYPELLEAGVVVSLGCDGTSASGNLDLMRQMYLAAGLFKDSRLDATLVPASKALRMATVDGARALLWDDEIGSLEKGKRADLVLFDLNDIQWLPCHDPLQALVYSATPRSIRTVLIDGRVVLEDGEIKTVDEKSILSEARQRATSIVARSGLRRGTTPVTTNLYD